MKPKLRDYLTILAALIVIFLCGAGVGYLIGEKKGRAQSSSTILQNGDETGDWQERTLTRLSRDLDLSVEQRKSLEAEVQKTSRKIQTSRDQAIGGYYRHLLDLHDQILPHLNPAQQEKIKKDRESLQQLLDSRFQSDATP